MKKDAVFNTTRVGEVVDRINETNCLLSQIVSSKESEVCIVYSKTGIGKSSLSKKIISTISAKQIDIFPIRIDTHPENSAKLAEEGGFIQVIFDKFLKEFDAIKMSSGKMKTKKTFKKLSFDYYVARSKDKNLKKEVLESIIEGCFKEDLKKAIPLTFLMYFIKRIFKIGEFNSQNILNNNIKHISIMSNYIKYVLSNNRILLNIDNLQNLDNYSLKYLIDWINETKDINNFFLFEYTTNDDGLSQNMWQLAERIQESGVIVELIKLDKMSPSDALETIKSMNSVAREKSSFDVSAISFYKNEDSGNLRKLLDYAITYKSTNKSVLDPTLENIRSLKKEALYILAIIILHKGKISKNLLDEILKSNNEFQVLNLKEISEELVEIHTLLDEDNNFYFVKHASIIDVWNLENFEITKYKLLAYRDCENYYRFLLENDCFVIIPKEKCITTLLNIYSIYEPNRIYDMLEHIRYIIVNSINPEKAWEYLSLLLSELNNKIDFVNIYFQIVNLCYEMDLYDKALYCLDELSTIENVHNSEKYKLYKCSLLRATNRHEEALYIAEEVIELSNNRQNILFAKLLLIIIYRSINCDKYYGVVDDIKSNEGYYRNYIEYGYFLRLAEIYNSRKDAIPYVKQSIKFFIEHKEIVQGAKSRMSLCYLYAITGKINEAYEEITVAEKVLSKHLIGRHVFFVNKTAICLLRGMYGSEIWDLLDRAELTARATFDILAIINNKLIWCIENKEFKKAGLLKNQAFRYMKMERDQHIKAILYYNLYLLAYQNGENILANEYYDIAYSLKEHCNTLRCRLGDLKITDGTQFLLSRPWHVCFLSYWNIDLLEVDSI